MKSKLSTIITGTKREAILVFLLLAFTYAYFYHDPGWNGNSRLGLTFAIVEEGHLTIDSFHNQVDTFTKDKAVFNGHYYTTKAIGSSIIAALFYFPIYQLENLLNIKINIGELKYLLTYLSIGLPSALSGSLMYVLCKQLSGDRFRSFVSTLAITLGTMTFPFSIIFFGHQLAGSLLFSAFFLIIQQKIKHNHHRNVLQFLVGFLLGCALITEYPTAPIILILAAYYFFIIFKNDAVNRSLAVILPAIGAFIPLVVALAYNMAVYGNPISTGYTYSAVPYFQQQQSQALVGISWPNPKAMFYMTLHPAFGLFWQSPVLILSFIGLWFMFRKPNFRVEALIVIFTFFSLLILYSGFYNWWGGWTFGPRYLIPMLPFLCLPLTFIPKRWFSSVVVLGLISVIQMFIVVFTQVLVPDDFFYQIDSSGFFTYSSIYSYCIKLLVNGEFSTNIGNKLLNLTSWVSLVPFMLVILIITMVFFISRDSPNHKPALSTRDII